MKDAAERRQRLLDHGYLEAVEHWGSDERIIEAARMSTDKGFRGWGPERFCTKHPEEQQERHRDGAIKDPLWACPRCGGWTERPGDEKLLRYLWENAHATPFEMAGLTIEVQAPIFVFREWQRHRVPFGYNELSARYTPMPNLNYVPTCERLTGEGEALTANKQSGTAGGLARIGWDDAREWTKILANFYDRAEEIYQDALRLGVPKELARLVVPVGRYSRMRATGNLRGWLGFCKLRCAPNAQYEIRVFANAVGELLSERFPRTWSIFSGGM